VRDVKTRGRAGDLPTGLALFCRIAMRFRDWQTRSFYTTGFHDLNLLRNARKKSGPLYTDRAAQTDRVARNKPRFQIVTTEYFYLARCAHTLGRESAFPFHRFQIS